jgi:hypothetical protein
MQVMAKLFGTERYLWNFELWHERLLSSSIASAAAAASVAAEGAGHAADR